MTEVSVLLAALVAGLVGSPHCVGMCGGFAALCGRRPNGTPAWNAGRLTSYVVLGAGAGALGLTIPGPAWAGAVLALLLLVWYSLSLAGIVRAPSIPAEWVALASRRPANREGLAGSYVFGIVTALLPCGLLYGALAVAVGTGSPLMGAASMAAFWVGTLPALTLLSVAIMRLAARSIWFRRAFALLFLAAGVWSIASRQGWVGHRRMHQHAIAAETVLTRR